LEDIPATPGLHYIQVQNRAGLFSNDFIFHIAENEAQAAAVNKTANPERLRSALAAAIRRDDLPAVKRLISSGAAVNAREDGVGSTPLSTAALHGHTEIAAHLIAKGARVSMTNHDGNTPLHVAAFLCGTEVIDLLLKHNANIKRRNNRRENVIDVVSGEWSEGLADFYKSIGRSSSLDLDLKAIRTLRPKLAGQFKRHREDSKKK